jgi:hypothetical protein
LETKTERFDYKLAMLPDACCVGEIVEEEEEVDNVEYHSR